MSRVTCLPIINNIMCVYMPIISEDNIFIFYNWTTQAVPCRFTLHHHHHFFYLRTKNVILFTIILFYPTIQPFYFYKGTQEEAEEKNYYYWKRRWGKRNNFIFITLPVRQIRIEDLMMMKSFTRYYGIVVLFVLVFSHKSKFS